MTRTSALKGNSASPSTIRARKASGRIPKRSANFNRLAVQLSLDASVQSIEYIDALSVGECRVRVEMLVALRNEGRFAFDIVDERPHHDLDADGMLLIALHQNGIALVEVDDAVIHTEPNATNCLRIWELRDRASTHDKALIKRTLSEHAELSIRELRALTGLRDPLAAVCGLIYDGDIEIDLAQKVDENSIVSIASDNGQVISPSCEGSPTCK